MPGFDSNPGQILGSSIEAGEIATGAVTTAKIADNAVTGAKIAMGSDAQGDVLFFNGTDYDRLGAGTSGQFLKTQGAGANPTWASVPTGAMTLIGEIDFDITNTGAKHDLGTVSVSAANFGADDVVYVVFWASAEGAVLSNMEFTVAGKTMNNVDLGSAFVAGKAWCTQNQTTNTVMFSYAEARDAGGTNDAGQAQRYTGLSANWITGTFDVKVRGDINTGTGKGQLKVYKLTGA